MKDLLAKIRGANDKAKCQLVAEVYSRVSPVLAELDKEACHVEMMLQSKGWSGDGIDVSKFDTQLDEIERILDELGRLFIPPEIKELFRTLEKRFKDNMKRHEGVAWQQVEQKLKVASKEKLQSLLQMEKTGGEPDVIKIDEKTGEIVFYDCSEESPTGRRNCVYDSEGEAIMKRDYPNETCSGNAVDMAVKMGVSILTEAEYRELQTKGVFDRNTWSWIKTPIDKREEGVTLRGLRDGVGVRVSKDNPYDPYDGRGFRSSLRV